MFAWKTGPEQPGGSRCFVRLDEKEMGLLASVRQLSLVLLACDVGNNLLRARLELLAKAALAVHGQLMESHAGNSTAVQVSDTSPVPDIVGGSEPFKVNPANPWAEILDEGFWQNFDAWATTNNVPKTLEGHERFIVAIGFALHWCARVSMHLEMERRNAARNEGDALIQVADDPPGKDVLGVAGATFPASDSENITAIMRSVDLLFTCETENNYVSVSGPTFRTLAGVCNVLSMAIVNRAKRQPK